jgi:hypothetical protein
MSQYEANTSREWDEAADDAETPFIVPEPKKAPETTEADKAARIDELRSKISKHTNLIDNYESLPAHMGEQADVVENEYSYDQKELAKAQRELEELEGK